LGDHYKDITKVLEFDEAKSNFLNACRNGLYGRFYWVNGKKYDAIELLTKELIPIAMEGLKKANIDENDIKHYGDILQERVKSGQTGSQWMLSSYTKLLRKTSPEEASAAVTASINKQQKENKPVHTWREAKLSDLGNWNPTKLVVSDFMQTELFTVYPSDIAQLVAATMDWRKINYVPVEDENGSFVGMITSRQMMRFLLNHYVEDNPMEEKEIITVENIMLSEPITVEPDLPLSEAIDMMQEHKIGGMPVVKDGKLQGIITEKDYLKVVARLSTLDKKED
jgi:CBS domain-containing protein